MENPFFDPRKDTTFQHRVAEVPYYSVSKDRKTENKHKNQLSAFKVPSTVKLDRCATMKFSPYGDGITHSTRGKDETLR